MKNKKLKIILIPFLSVIIGMAIIVFALEYFSKYKVSKTIHVNASVITKKSIVINVPTEKVWKIFSDVDSWNTWQKEIVNPAINGAFKAGASFNWKSNGLAITSKLQTVEVNKMVGWSGPAFGSFAIHTWYFTEQNGKTTVRVEESMEGWLVKLLKNKFQTGLDTSIEHWLNYLKIESEKSAVVVFVSPATTSSITKINQ
ncbi:SRPBCC family protein [Ferruginibacter paludis]|uniref:SRPBCC family protein n=1 Tax=Ferruginibacter paludis TaxID=1310417 RepID=UPI0025B2CEB2|nr:SRPBCC family protein [Ferruginibacter paludis]MDN3657466.1 SRPBCC family protein [Ferruginibacter paludis]